MSGIPENEQALEIHYVIIVIQCRLGSRFLTLKQGFKAGYADFLFQLTLCLLVVLATVAWEHTTVCTVSTRLHIRRVASLKTSTQ
jgi:hypothetical protein